MHYRAREMAFLLKSRLMPHKTNVYILFLESCSYRHPESLLPSGGVCESPGLSMLVAFLAFHVWTPAISCPP